MRASSRFGLLLLLLSTVTACAGPRPPRGPAPPPAPGEPPESFAPPFEAEHPYRGPGLTLDGMRLVSERGAARLDIGAFDHGRDIVFFVSPTRETPANWLDACPRSATDPKEPRIQVRLQGAEDAGRDAVYDGETGWWTSVDVDQYVRLSTIRVEVCGTLYTLSSGHDARLALHARLANERATRKRQEEDALPKACQAGNGAACTELGGLARDQQAQRRLYERACALGHLVGCSRFADMMLQGKGGERNPEQALRILIETCEKGDDGSCLGASRALINRPSAHPLPSAEERYRKGAALARRACEVAGETAAVSCLWAAELHAAGFGVVAAPALVESFSDKSCRKGYQKACQLRDALTACARGLGDACARLAEAERRSRHPAIKDNGKEALWRLAACNRGHAVSCAPRAM